MKGFRSHIRATCRNAVVAIFGASATLGCQPAPEAVELEEVSMATAHPNAERFVVQGDARTDLIVKHTWTQTLHTNRGTPSGTTQRHTYLVPVVGEDWTRGKPVSMWLTCPTQKTCQEGPGPWLARVQSELDGKRVEVEVADRVGRAISFHRPPSHWLDGVQRAKASGLHSAHHAPIVRWPVD